MSVSKWLFGGLGFVLGGPIGALLGVALGALLDRMSTPVLLSDDDEDADSSDSGYQTGGGGASSHTRATGGDVRISLLVLTACVIKADGRVLKSEVAFVKPYLIKWFGEENALQALQLLKRLLQQDIDTSAVSAQIAAHLNYSTRLEILHMLLGLAEADGEFSASEEKLIAQIATELGVTQADYVSLAALYHRKTDANWAYTALGISPSATDEEVKRAYRRMAMKYHPDKVTDAAEEVRQQAAAKFRAVKEAYDHIKLLRGMK